MSRFFPKWTPTATDMLGMERRRIVFVPVPDGFMSMRVTEEPDVYEARRAIGWRLAHD